MTVSGLDAAAWSARIAEAYECDAVHIVSARLLDGSLPDDVSRSERYRAAVEGGLTEAAAPVLIGVTGRVGSDGPVVEFLSYVPSTRVAAVPTTPETVSFLVTRCDITYESLSPTQCIEFSFADELPHPTWHLSKTSHDGFDHFIQCKFKVWEKAIREPDCEAAFRRMLNRGLVYKTYDTHMFPTPAHLEERYRVVDEISGKVVVLPHSVERCRVWNATESQFTELNTRLAGAPKDDAEAKTYWENLLQELREKRGAQYIDELLAEQQQQRLDAAAAKH